MGDRDSEDEEDDELVASTPKQMNWRGILIALLVIVAVLGLIVFSIVLLSPPYEGDRIKGHKFTLDDVLGPLFKPPRFNGTWVSEVDLVFRDIHGGVTVFNAENLTSRVLMTNSTFRQLNAVDFKISSDLSFILLISNVKKIYKYTFEAKYSIYEVETQNKYHLAPFEVDSDQPSLQYVAWSPGGNALAFVYKNDVYYKPRAKSSEIYKVTNTGELGVIYNGVPDWLYEEEILKSSSALWFSPDGQYLLFASFNDTLVGELKYPWYGSLEVRLRYPQIRSIRYPKAGTTNPTAILWAVDLNHPSQLEPVALKPSQAVSSTEDYYFTAVTWLTGHQVGVVWMNRRQNVSTISICRGTAWTCEDTYTERSGERGWVEVYQPPLFSSDGSSYLVRLPVLDGNNGFYKHVVHVNVATKQVTPLTHGKFEVTEILKWDEERNLVYFLAAPENKSGERHLCRARDLNSTLRFWDCLTCPQEQMTHAALVVSETTTHPTATIPTSQIYGSSVSNGSGSGREWEPMSRVPVCLYSVPKFSMGPSPRFFALECLGPDPPSVSLVEVSSNTRILTLDSYSIWRERFHSMAAPQIKTFKVQVDVGVHAQVRLHLPPGFREKEEMTFPLVLHVCGAPGSQLVSERWGVDWGTYLASSRNFIVAEIDGRGSGFQGDSFLHKLRHHLGSTEVADQIVVIKYLRDNLNFIDKEKIAVWGWSYGGFAAAMILAEDTEVFCCGISVAPITSWAHYDSVYTERYMGTPNVTDNYLGYEQSDITKRAGNLKEKEFLLIHGTADDTVHYQQSMMLVKALTEEGVLFRHLTYPDEGHTFSGVQQHLYKAMEAFLDDCFGPLDFEEWEVGTGFLGFKQ